MKTETLTQAELKKQRIEDFNIQIQVEKTQKLQKKLSNKIFRNCTKDGANKYRIQFEWFEKNPNTERPIPELSHTETVKAWQDGLSKYNYYLTGKR